MLSSLAGRRIELWVEARGGVAAINPVMQALIQNLEAAGATVDVRVPGICSTPAHPISSC
jgi:hypothetical protein